jgi:membrane protein DedA with SNARE-associated domain/membrane-associated phospholipid phosphatase
MHLPETRTGWIKLALVAAAAVGAYFAIKGLLPDLDLQELLADVSATLGDWTYLIVTVFAFLETGAFVGLVVPGETLVVLAGAVAGQGETSIVLTIALVWVAAFLGDSVSYLIGAKLGRGFVLRHGEKLRISRERFAQVEGYFERHGGKTILVGRFIGLVRALAPFIAGSSGMRYAALVPYSILGTGLWAATFSLLGYFASQSIERVVEASERVVFGFGLFVAIVVAAIVAVRWLRQAENRQRAARWMESKPGLGGLVSLGRRLGPQARFLWGRLTPGGLGLEFTAPVAALAVGAYVFVGYAVILGDNPAATATDRAAREVVAQISMGWLDSVAKVVTWFGSAGVTVVVGAVAALVLALRRHWVETAVVALAMATLLLLVPETKELVDRPRPTGGLVDAGGQAYPSGHAAYSVLYAWLAVTLAVRLRAGPGSGGALIVAGLVVSAAIGLSRVYLRVHWLSDVNGGWGLGVAAFSFWAALAVLVMHFRHNSRDGTAGSDLRGSGPG